jgi:hypothetical protein
MPVKVCQIITNLPMTQEKKLQEKQAHGQTAPGKTFLSTVNKNDAPRKAGGLYTSWVVRTLSTVCPLPLGDKK